MRSILSALHLSSAKNCAYNGLCAAWYAKTAKQVSSNCAGVSWRIRCNKWLRSCVKMIVLKEILLQQTQIRAKRWPF